MAEQNEMLKAEILYAKLLKDRDFQRFQILSENPNIFEVLRAQTYEIRHSNFLAWLLDPKGNHALGDQILRAFLTDLSLDERSSEFSVMTIQDLDFNDVTIYREWNNIDIVLVFKNLVVALENKINHTETKGQLERYKTLIDKNFHVEHKVFVFMNPYGIVTKNEDYVSYSYETFINYIEQVLELNNALLPRTKMYLEDYLNNMKNNIMGTGSKNEIANKLYRNHKELFDYVFENKSNYIFEIKSIIQKRIEDRGWILTSPSKPFLRFLTKDLNEVIPKDVVQGWRNGEAFLFEVYFYANQNNVQTYATLGPCGETMRRQFLEYLNPLQTSKKVAKSYSYFKTKTFDAKKYNDISSEQDMLEMADAVWNSIEKMVADIEPLLLTKILKPK